MGGVREVQEKQKKKNIYMRAKGGALWKNWKIRSDL